MIKSDQNYRSYNLNSIPLVLYFVYLCQLQWNELSVQFLKVLMYLDCLSQSVSISRLHVFYKYYYFSLRKRWPTIGGCSNLKLTHFSINKQDPFKILKMFELKVLLTNIFMKNITQLLHTLKNNCYNFRSIWSNEVPISSQDKELSDCPHLFHMYFLKFATMKG